ncbi:MULTISPECIES: lipocalin-like domain-containing protein [unclassified Halomonas]|uniref:lipocalin-like domain-containing protein n=1 Tax=unclassified Halomonas TaxID=2609666 RepID=UPI002883D176|nr:MULTISPECIES: lipocalin-like domain-containing protein [unclassified Halomonas]MDT0500012.1 lipocalin-like domain-containing protein [Halomonas sp. PAR7]MDT0512416.1 lipocalin-like domain-containing protein [Halomonas sp. LES1]MDT0591050.1 lipocalin-like domain-containing protein [Halomonas sp. PAR8]
MPVRAIWRSWRPVLLLGSLLGALLAMTGCDDASPERSSAGFAGLGESDGGFMQASPDTPLHFPADHGSHPGYRIEWWYLTANLEDEQGEPLGLQWTLFRQALLPPGAPPGETPSEPAPWVADQLWMAHMAVSRGGQHAVSERFARSHSAPPPQQAASQAGATAHPFRAWIDDWSLASDVSDPEADTFERLRLTAFDGKGDKRFGYRLELTAEGPLVRHGDSGFSQKSADGQGSHYYSQPFWRIEGEVTLAGETREVSGRGWLDREWSSQLLSPDQTGWDWFSLHLDSGNRLMAFRLRGGGDDGGDYRSGSWILADGTTHPLGSQELAMTPLATTRVAGHEMPTRWRLKVPKRDLDLIVEAPHAERWMETTVPYWEGEVIARDHDGGEQLGVGYLEMTGY